MTAPFKNPIFKAGLFVVLGMAAVGFFMWLADKL